MAQPWETANQGLARVDERLLTPPELRSSLRPAGKAVWWPRRY
ncbi:Uncharacterised protein [Bordetella pertussis]|nr:Uncharacterised protein [Bordetella pertussis]